MRLVVFRWLQNIFLALAKQLDGARKWLSISEKRFNLFGTATGAVEVMKQWRFYDLMSNVFTPPLQRNFPLASKSSKLIFAINWNRISPLRMSLEFCFIPRASSQRKYCRIIHKAKQTFCLLFGISTDERNQNRQKRPVEFAVSPLGQITSASVISLWTSRCRFMFMLEHQHKSSLYWFMA